MADDVALAVDIGGTFTDVVLRAGPKLFVEKTLTTPDDLLRGFFDGVHAVLAKAPADAGRRRRRDRARHDRRHQRADRAQGPARRDGLHARLRRHPADPRRAPLRHVRSADRVSRTAGRARAFVHRRRAHVRGRFGREAAEASATSSDWCSSFARPRHRTRSASASCTATATPRTSSMSRAKSASGCQRADLAELRNRPADPRIPARLDHGGERLHHADHRALSRPARATAAGRRVRHAPR